MGFTEERDDGVCYHPEIEFEGANGLVRFVSVYGSGKKPSLGAEVDIVIDEDGQGGEQITVSNRTLFTVVPLLFGLLFILVGLNVEPLEPTEEDGAGQSASAPGSTPENNKESEPDAEKRP